MILRDPAVESLSSFIGVDGVNTTINSGRIQINLKPLEARKISSSDVIRRLQPQLDKVDGITLFMQAVQDLTVEDRVSRTQFQYSLEDPDPKELAEWTTRLVDQLQAAPDLRDVASDQQNLGLQAHLVIDRVTAARFGITPLMIDDTLYDSFGQRQISIMFTQLNQYRVVMEVRPEWQQRPGDLKNLYIRSAGGGQVPLNAITHYETRTTPLTVNHQGQFPSATVSFNLAPGASLGEAVTAVDAAQKAIGMPRSVQTAFQGTAAAFQNSLANEGWLLLAAIVTVYIVLGVLYESYIHPITIISTLPSAGVGALLALMICRQDFSVIALIGMILSDRHREKERDHDDRLRAGGGAQGAPATAGGDLPGLPAAFPADHDDHDGGAAGRHPAGAGQGDRVRAAPAAGDRDRRRTAAEPVADAVHDAGDLPVVRPSGAAFWIFGRGRPGSAVV